MFFSPGNNFLINNIKCIFKGCLVTPECFGQMTWLLSSLAGGKIILCLEGGYNLESVSYSATMCIKALLGDPLPALKRPLVPTQHAVDTISNVIRTHSKYWSSLSFQVSNIKKILYNYLFILYF